MQSLRVLVAVPAAIVALIRIIGALTGNKWLGNNWQESVGYIGAAFLLTYGCAVPVLLVAGHRGRLRSHLLQVEERLGPRRFPVKPNPPGPRWAMALFGLALGLPFVLASYLIVRNPDGLWWLGILGIVIFVVHMGASTATILRAALFRRPCPWCLQSIKPQALVCHHCHRRVEDDGPYDQDPDLMWL